MFFYNESEENNDGGAISLVEATDPYFYNVGLLLKMDNDFTDSSINNHTVTVVGNSSINTETKKYGDGAGYLDGSGDVLRVTGDSSLAIGTGDFTIEMWAYFPILRDFMPLIDTNHYTNGILWRVMGNGRTAMWFSNAAGPVMPAGSITTNQWYHIALTRENGVARTFLDGVLIDTVTNTKSVTMGNIRIGQSAHNTSEYLRAYLDDYRITVGVARYTADFTPPGSLPTEGPGIITDSLTLNLDIGDDSSYAGTGTTVNNIAGSDTATLAGNVAFSPNNEGYLDFDGADDTMVVANGSSVDITGAITIETWINPDAVNGWTAVVYKNNIQQAEGYHMGFDPGGNLAGGVRNSGTWYTTQPGAVASVAVGQWQHFVMSMDTETNVQKFYKNGVLVYTNSNFTRNLFSNTNPLSISGQPITGVEKYNGKLAKTALYSRALTDEEVAQNFNALKSRFGL